ncbi:MAG: SGNH/GDSL hydrolase family protein [Terracidiphilus sp.]
MPQTPGKPNKPRAGRRLVRWIALLLGGIFVLLVASDLILGLVFGLGNPVLIAPDAACNYITKPNQNVYRFFKHTRTNQYGMRSAPFPAVPPAGTMRILFVGDSVTYGTSRVGQSQIFTQILRRELPAVVDRPVEVLNASASAWAIDNELSYIRSRGIFDANPVVLVVNDGDVTQPRSTMAQLGSEQLRARPATALSEVWMRFIAPRLFDEAPRVDAGDSIMADAAKITRANLADLDAFQKIVSSDGSRMVLMYVPLRHDLPDAAAPEETILRNWAAAEHVAMLDLTSTEMNYSTHAITLDGNHLNAEGNRVIADAVEKLWPRTVGLSK